MESCSIDTLPCSGPIPEDIVLDPVSPYGISKFATEKIANQYYISHGIPALTARIFIHVGVGGTDSLAINQFCKQVALAELGFSPPVIKHGNLDTARDITDAKDSAVAMIALAEKGEPGEGYNVGSGNSMRISDLLKIAVSMSKVPMTTELDETRLRSFDEKVLVANVDKLKKVTGWTPKPDMEGTIGNILAYWRTKVRTLYCKRPDGTDKCATADST